MSAPVARVVVVGSLNRDYVVRVERIPRPGETVIGGTVSLGSGGKGGNQAVAAAVVGAAYGVGCAIVGAVGDDPDGEALTDDLRMAGVDVGEVAVLPGVRTGVALISVSGDGENAIVVAPGANHEVDPDRATQALGQVLAPGDVVLLQGELPQATTETVLRAAAAAGARPVLNLAPVGPMAATAVGLADPLVVNRGEAADLIGEDVSGESPRSLAGRLAPSARSVVVTAGAGGAGWAAGGETGHVAAPTLAAGELVDTTGAGDGFTGALAVALALGQDLATAARWGTAIGTDACRRPGTQAAYPRDTTDLQGLLGR